MKKILFAAVLACAVLSAACGKKSSLTEGDKSKLDSLSYALGVDVGGGFERAFAGLPLDFASIEKGVRDGAHDKGTIKRDSSMKILQDYFMTKRPQRAQATAERNAEMLANDSTYVADKIDTTLFENAAERELISYCIGSDLGFNINDREMPVQLYWFMQGMQTTYEGGELSISKEEAGAYLQNYFMVVLPARNKAENEAWLEKVAKKSGVKKTDSGLLYKVEKEGDMTTAPKDDRDQVKVQYTGWNHKDKVFDSSIFKNLPKERQDMMKQYNPEGYDKNEPAQFPLNGVIKGWGEGLKLVGKGGKITLWIPAALAYGEQGSWNNQKDIPGNEALRFEIEVVDVIPFVEPTVVATPEQNAAETAVEAEPAPTK